MARAYSMVVVLGGLVMVNKSLTDSRPGKVKSGQVKSGQVKSGQVKSGQVRAGQDKSDQVKNSICT